MLAVGCLALLCLAACRTDEEPEAVYSDIPVEFSATLADTRAGTSGDITGKNIASMGVYAYASGTTDYDGDVSKFEFNYMKDQLMTRDVAAGTGWIYSPKKYWPLNANEKISFYAYAPYKTDIEANGNEIIATSFHDSYRTAAFYNYTATTDLLLSEVRNCTRQTNSVAFLMKHALTKVSFYIRTTRTGTNLKVNSVTPQGYKAGAYRISSGILVKKEAEVVSYERKNLDVTVPEGADAALVESFFMTPDNTDLTFDVTYTDYTGGGSVTETITGKFSDYGIPWTSGAAIAYELVIENKNVTITATTLPSWNSGSMQIRPIDDFGNGYDMAINSAEALVAFRDKVNNRGAKAIEVIQTCDIDLADLAGTSDATNWTPIQDFQGLYNGNGYTIKGLNITGSNDALTDIGLFGTCHGMLIGINLRDVTIKATKKAFCTGALVGSCMGGVISYCSATGVINDVSMASYYPELGSTGGLVGVVEENACITRCTTHMNITGNVLRKDDLTDEPLLGNVGGLIGLNKGTVAACAAWGDILLENPTVYRNNVELSLGGFVGSNKGGLICGSYARGNVEMFVDNTQSIINCNAGGFLGALMKGTTSSGSTVISCYSAGNVTLDLGYAGGFVGSNSCYNTAMQYCCSKGVVDSHSRSGSFTGRVWELGDFNNEACFTLQSTDPIGVQDISVRNYVEIDFSLPVLTAMRGFGSDDRLVSQKYMSGSMKDIYILFSEYDISRAAYSRELYESSWRSTSWDSTSDENNPNIDFTMRF